MNSVHSIALYVKNLKPEVSPLKLQKSLYFMYAYYGAFYDKELFAAEFEAWNYGSVIREVYEKNKAGDYDNQDFNKETIEDEEQRKFIEELFSQIDSVSDFTLVSRNHQDEVWQEAKKGRTEEQIGIIDNKKLIAEYKRDYI